MVNKYDIKKPNFFELFIEKVQYPMKMKGTPKFVKLNYLKINVFELKTFFEI